MQKHFSDSEVTICACSSRQIMNKTEISKLASALQNAGYTVNIIPDLCKTAISNIDRMLEIASSTVVACYPRAVKSIFNTLGLIPKQILDIRNESGEKVLEQIGINTPVFSPEYLFPEFSSDEDQEAWNPVIDKDRCTECAKCHDFCLFGVYSIDEGLVKVTQPKNCKNNCPACARVCPSKAVIFPKYEKSPINGGIIDEEQAVEVDTKALYNKALRYKLEERKAKISLLRKDQ